MDQEQLTLFGAEDVIGSGRLYPWPAAVEPEPEAPVENPDQLTFDEAETGEAA